LEVEPELVAPTVTVEPSSAANLVDVPTMLAKRVVPSFTYETLKMLDEERGAVFFPWMEFILTSVYLGRRTQTSAHACDVVPEAEQVVEAPVRAPAPSAKAAFPVLLTRLNPVPTARVPSFPAVLMKARAR